jgi:myo-inositol-1(or 4)-monophosphatase
MKKLSSKQAMLKDMINLSKRVGRLQLKYLADIHQKTLHSVNKGAQGMCTEADLESEKMILTHLAKRYPQHRVLSEEASFQKSPQQNFLDPLEVSDEDGLWVIDPLDGTTNFMSGLPLFTVSIAFMQKGRVELGVIHQPNTQETFYALRGKGAYCERKYFHKTVIKKMSQKASRFTTKEALISTNLGSKRHNAELIRKFPEVRTFRRLGSAALELAYVAAGYLDGYWEYRLQPWDIAAGALLCQEAGCSVTDLKGRPYSPFCPQILAARKHLSEELLSVLSSH